MSKKLSNLPDDVLILIASRLPLPLRSRFGKTCKHLRLAATSVKVDEFQLVFQQNNTRDEEVNGTRREAEFFFICEHPPFRRHRKVFGVSNANRLQSVQEVQSLLFEVRESFHYRLSLC